jgi:hypothetical protein
MENNEINKNDTEKQVSPEKKRKTHLAIALSIIAAALVIAAIFAIVAVVGSMVSKEGLSLDGTKLNGQTASELYDSIESGMTKNDNYSVSLTKHGIVTANAQGTALSIEITSHIDSKVDGNNFYYKKITTTKYRSAISNEMTEDESVIEITVADGYVYFTKAGQKFKAPVNSDEYKKNFDVISEMIWENGGGVFKDAKITEKNGGYEVSATNIDKKIVGNDARSFFNGTKGEFIWALMPIYSGESCGVIYDSDSRPVSASYGYTISNDALSALVAPLTGSVAMSANVNYGGVSVSRPADAGEYIEVGADQLPQ